MKNVFDAFSDLQTKKKLRLTAKGIEKVRRTEEEDSQGLVIEWAKKTSFNNRVIFDYLIHHPAEGQRGPAAQRTAKKLGLKSGILDLQLIVPIGNVPGLWIEMKAKDGRWMDSQLRFREIALEMGYVVHEARSAEAAIAIIKDWLARFAAHQKSE